MLRLKQLQPPDGVFWERPLDMHPILHRLLLNRGIAGPEAAERFLRPTREQLLDEIWDSAGEYVSDNTLTVYIKRLREKLEEDPQDPRLILTVRGIGYQLKE